MARASLDERFLKILDKVDELAGETRSILGDYQLQATKIRSELYRLFEETRKVRKMVDATLEGCPCRKCGLLFGKEELDVNQFCEGCRSSNDENKIVEL